MHDPPIKQHSPRGRIEEALISKIFLRETGSPNLVYISAISRPRRIYILAPGRIDLPSGLSCLHRDKTGKIICSPHLYKAAFVEASRVWTMTVTYREGNPDPMFHCDLRDDRGEAQYTSPLCDSPSAAIREGCTHGLGLSDERRNGAEMLGLTYTSVQALLASHFSSKLGLLELPGVSEWMQQTRAELAQLAADPGKKGAKTRELLGKDEHRALAQWLHAAPVARLMQPAVSEVQLPAKRKKLGIHRKTSEMLADGFRGLTVSATTVPASSSGRTLPVQGAAAREGGQKKTRVDSAISSSIAAAGHCLFVGAQARATPSPTHLRPEHFEFPPDIFDHDEGDDDEDARLDGRQVLLRALSGSVEFHEGSGRSADWQLQRQPSVDFQLEAMLDGWYSSHPHNND